MNWLSLVLLHCLSLLSGLCVMYKLFMKSEVLDFKNLVKNKDPSFQFLYMMDFFKERNSIEANIFLDVLFLLHLVSSFPRIVKNMFFVSPMIELKCRLFLIHLNILSSFFTNCILSREQFSVQ